MGIISDAQVEVLCWRRWTMIIWHHLPPHCIERDVFLPFSTVKFGSLDYCMKQPHKTLVYTKASQFWAEKAQLPTPGQPCQLAEGVWELREAMEPLTTFTDEELLSDNVPLHLVKITSSQTSKPEEPASPQEQSHSRNRRAHSQHSFMAVCSLGRLKPAATPWVASPFLTHEQKVLPPGFAEIANSLRGDNFPHTTVEVPQELTAPQGLLVRTATATMISMSLCQDVALGTIYLDMVTTSMSLVGLGATPEVVNCPCLHWGGWKTQSIKFFSSQLLIFVGDYLPWSFVELTFS